MTVVTKLEVEKTKEVPILKIDEKVVKRQLQFIILVYKINISMVLGCGTETGFGSIVSH